MALVINKIDRVKAEALLALSQQVNATFDSRQYLHDLGRKGWLRRPPWTGWPLKCPGALALPEDQVADLPMRAIAAEITREKLTLRLHGKSQLTVETEVGGKPDGSARVDQIIYVAAPATRASSLVRAARRSRPSDRPPAPNGWSSWAARPPVPSGEGARELAGRAER